MGESDTQNKKEQREKTRRSIKIKVPSISAPIKEVAHVAVPMLAMDSAFKAVDKFRHPENAQQGQSMHNEYY